MTMVIVESFLRYPSSCTEWIKGPDERGGYCKINYGDGREETRKIISRNKELLYGFISITYNGNEILGEDFLTRIDDLWGPLVDIVAEFMENDFASGSFADSNTDFSLKLADDEKVEIELGKHSYFMPKKEFLLKVLIGAKEFFTHYMEATETDYYNITLERIETYMERL